MHPQPFTQRIHHEHIRDLMHNKRNKPFLILALLLLCPCLHNCESQFGDELDDLKLDDGLHKLLIVPENPSSEDQVLAIETICGNESDVILDFQREQINYTRYVNSLMMMPCSPRPDTTIIGQLSTGQYQLVHCVIDKNHLLTDSIVLLDTIYLHIK